MDDLTTPDTGDSKPNLMTIPLELRHNIFSFVSERPEGPNEVLRKWFEKKEIAQIQAERMALDEEEDEEDEDEDEDDEEGDGDNDGDEGDEDEDDDNDDDGEEDEDVDMPDADGDGDGTTTTATVTRTQAPIIQASSKWRHIPGIMQITHCPPPLNLLLACKALHEEGLNWYYNVAIVKIDATAAFVHVTFFEDSLREISDALYSPMKHIRRVHVTMSYDSAWLKAQPDLEPSIFQAILGCRVTSVVEVLAKTPNLRKLLLKWYDSSADPEAVSTKCEILDLFNGLFAEIEIEEHILADGVDADADSVHGLRRLEFEDILDQGFRFY